MSPRAMASRAISIAATALLCSGAGVTSAFAQSGCYFGVCPGDPGTEFPQTQSEPLPVPLPVPQPRTETPEPQPQAEPEPPQKPNYRPPRGEPEDEQSGQSSSALADSCRSAFHVAGEFVWNSPMGTRNALAVCEAAVREDPEDAELLFFYAAARDMISELRENPADNYFAVQTYRDLAETGFVLAEYALATMHDEDSGVGAEEAAALFRATIEANIDTSATCDSIQALTQEALGGSGEISSSDLSTLEQLARTSPRCADALIRALQPLDALPELPLPYEAYLKFAAVHMTSTPMSNLGTFYSYGGEAYTSGKYHDVLAIPKDLARGGYWLILRCWRVWNNWNEDFADSTFIDSMFDNAQRAMAAQTALKQLGFYNGAIDGAFGARSREALAAFVRSGTAETLFQRVRRQEFIHPAFAEPAPLPVGQDAFPTSLFQ